MEQFHKIHYTDRELQVIKFILLCKPRKIIHALLGISTETLKTHIRSIYLKTDKHCISDLVVFLLSSDFKVNPERTEVTFEGKPL